MNERVENIPTIDDIYNSLKDHPYINEITIHNGLDFHDKFSAIYAYIYGWEPDKVKDKYKDVWNKDSKHFIVPELALLSIECHDINMMGGALKGREDNCELNKIHHTYMMEIFDIIASLTGNGPKKEYINIWKEVRTKEGGWKWRTFLYKAIKNVAHLYKDGHCDYSYSGINCIRESKVESVIERYKKTIQYYLDKGEERYAKLTQDELDDLINRTNKWHIVISDEEYVKNFINYE
ncbi:MAG: hypothetical protein IJH39_11060 [Clostridia bacterium]|nr:hypothetical protein [Clostridia bacterium]